MYNDEDWKIYELPKEIYTENKLAFSRFGETLSITSKNPEGNIIHGSLREGYPIITFSYKVPIDESMESLLSEKEEKIKTIRSEIKELKRVVALKSTIGKELITKERQIKKLRAELELELSTISKLRKKDYKKRRRTGHLFVHRAVAELYIPNDYPKNKPFVIHKNFNKEDNRVENLDWATKDEVLKRSFESPNYIKFKINKTKRSPTLSSKLDYNDVIFIKRKLEKGEPMARLARRFGVSSMQIYRIKTGENWGDVKLSIKEK